MTNTENRTFHQISIFDFLDDEPKQENGEAKTYSYDEIKLYIMKNTQNGGDRIFYNIALCNAVPTWESRITPQEHFEYFKTLLHSMEYKFISDEIDVFTMKHSYSNVPDCYSVFINVHGDFIVEVGSVENVYDGILSMPACGIRFYAPNGTPADMCKYLNITEDELNTFNKFVYEQHGIIPPKESKSFSTHEWSKDRREYYFFYKMHLKEFGHAGRCKLNYDSFVDYTFTLRELIDYLEKRYIEKGENDGH